MKIERAILAELELTTALHVGIGKGSKPTDSPLRRSGDCRIVLPGRAIGGALRTLATRLAPRLEMFNVITWCKAILPPDENNRKPCGCVTCQLFGDLYPDEDDENGGSASLLWISDAFLISERQTHVRDGVGLARDTGVAARNIKFDFETVPRGARFSFRLRLEDDDSPAAEFRVRLLAAVLAEWEAGRGRLGAGAARGLGGFKLEEVRYRKTRLATADELVAHLGSADPWQLGDNDASYWSAALTAARQSRQSLPDDDLPVARGFVAVSFNLEFDGPFLSNDPLVALLSGFDHAPQLEAVVGAAGAPLISGGSLRGALRARAEKIARTLWSLHWPSGSDFLTHCPACHTMQRDKRAPLASCDARLDTPTDKETSESDLCLACQLFGSTRRGSRLWVEDAHWTGAKPDQNTWKAQDFLAIDRFTGGGQDGAKFDAAPLVNARFAGRLVLHSPRKWELGWLALTLRDLCDGRLPIGFGAAKGYGRAKAVDFEWQLGVLSSDDFPWAVTLFEGGESDGIYTVRTRTHTEMMAQQQDWVEAFLAQRDSYQPGPNCPPPQTDTIFAQAADTLYGLPHSGR